jgi:hypothetical protein
MLYNVEAKTNISWPEVAMRQPINLPDSHFYTQNNFCQLIQTCVLTLLNNFHDEEQDKCTTLLSCAVQYIAQTKY